MKLFKHDLSQFNSNYLNRLTHEQLLALSEKLLSDLKDLHDRLGQNSINSSIPSGALPPWINARPGPVPLQNSDEEDIDDSIVDIDSSAAPSSPSSTDNESSGKEVDEKDKSAGNSSTESAAVAMDRHAPPDDSSVMAAAATPTEKPSPRSLENKLGLKGLVVPKHYP